jgi:antitoxin component YwqK of YwqJK toxin-antitoxin module
MTKTSLIILGLLQFPLFSRSQEKIQLYYNRNWEITEKSKAEYVRDAEYDLNNFKLNGKVIDHSLEGTLIMEGNYSIGIKNGQFTFYYNTGKINCKGEYADNKRFGDWKYYYENGKLKQVIFFSDGTRNIDFAVGEYYDREGNQLVKNGTGKWVNDSVRPGFYHGSSLHRITGEFKDSLKVGKWELTRLSDNKVVHTERFRKGKFIEGNEFDSQFNSDKTAAEWINKLMVKMSLEQANLPGSDDEIYHGQRFKKGFVHSSYTDYTEPLKSEMINKVPDKNINKLNNTEQFKLDTAVFQKSLINADVETIFKTVTGKEIKINNRSAMYPEGDYSLISYIERNLRYPLSAMAKKD